MLRFASFGLRQTICTLDRGNRLKSVRPLLRKPVNLKYDIAQRSRVEDEINAPEEENQTTDPNCNA